MKPMTSSAWTVSVRVVFVALLLGFGSVNTASAQHGMMPNLSLNRDLDAAPTIGNSALDDVGPHRGCYVPDVGVMYFIEKPGLPSACLAGHETVSWSSGDITEVSAGFGITGGGFFGSVNVAVNTGLIQRRVTGSCPSGQAIRVINAVGGVTCGSAGVGSITSVQGPTVSVNRGQSGSGDADCPAGRVAIGGGWRNLNEGTTVLDSFGLDSNTWRVSIRVPASSVSVNDAYQVFVVCALP